MMLIKAMMLSGINYSQANKSTQTLSLSYYTATDLTLNIYSSLLTHFPCLNPANFTSAYSPKQNMKMVPERFLSAHNKCLYMRF